MGPLSQKLALLATVASIGLFAFYKLSSDFTYSIPANFKDSETMKIINPRGNKFKCDSYSKVIRTDKSCEQVVAGFTKGFFGGPAMLMERSLFRFLLKDKYQSVGFTKLDDSESAENIKTYLMNVISIRPVSKKVPTIWDPKDISATEVLPVNTIFYGSFQIANHEVSKDTSFIDVIFGSDLAGFSGSHRFEATRIDKDHVKVSLHHFRCNPTLNEFSNIEYVRYFHYVYARALFFNVIQLIKRG